MDFFYILNSVQFQRFSQIIYLSIELRGRKRTLTKYFMNEIFKLALLILIQNGYGVCVFRVELKMKSQDQCISAILFVWKQWMWWIHSQKSNLISEKRDELLDQLNAQELLFCGRKDKHFIFIFSGVTSILFRILSRRKKLKKKKNGKCFSY